MAPVAPRKPVERRIYQQTVIDTYSKVAFAKLYDTKTALTAADVLNDKVVPFFDEQDITISRVLTDRGTEYCGRPCVAARDSARHDYELYLAIENIDHSRTKAKSPQTTDVIDKPFLRLDRVSYPGAGATTCQRAGLGMKRPSRRLYRGRFPFVASLRAAGPRGCQPVTKRV